jgi:hypothetical protein
MGIMKGRGVKTIKDEKAEERHQWVIVKIKGLTPMSSIGIMRGLKKAVGQHGGTLEYALAGHIDALVTDLDRLVADIMKKADVDAVDLNDV